jgi:hypothetical protein
MALVALAVYPRPIRGIQKCANLSVMAVPGVATSNTKRYKSRNILQEIRNRVKLPHEQSVPSARQIVV